MQIPRLIIAGTHSGVGKTSVTLGLLRALRRRGLTVQPFKVGPDFLDPGLHTIAADAAGARVSRNLGVWPLSPAPPVGYVARAPGKADIASAEGVLGVDAGGRGPPGGRAGR